MGVGIPEVENEPVDVLGDALFKAEFLENELSKAKEEYDQSSSDVSLEEIKDLADQLNQEKENIVKIESGLLTKSIELVALLSDEERDKIHGHLKSWKADGLLNGEEVSSHTMAISKAIDLVIKGDVEKGGEGSRGGHVIGHTRNGKAIYEKEQNYPHFDHHDHLDAADLHAEERDKYPVNHSSHDHHDIMVAWHKNKAKEKSNPYSGGNPQIAVNHLKRSYFPFAKAADDGEGYTGHYANVLLKKEFVEGGKKTEKILFLKRAPGKAIAPNQYCLPGGHIDEGENIIEAGARELKEEANIDGQQLYITAKAKCDNGKWAFYLKSFSAVPDSTLALLDGENIGACWMSREEWMDADLFFDLKEHLLGIEEPLMLKISEIPTINKGEEDGDLEKGQFYGAKTGKGEGARGGRVIGHTKSGRPVYARLSASHSDYKHFSHQDHKDAARFHGEARSHGEGHTFGTSGSSESFWHGKKQQEHEHEAEKKRGTVQKAEEENDLEKGGKKGTEGEIRTWKGRKFQKHGKMWIEVRDPKNKKLAVADVVAHAENTSTPRLKQVSTAEEHPHNDAAKRELERRKSEKDKIKSKSTTGVAVPTKKKPTPKPVNVKKHKGIEQLSKEHPDLYSGDFDKFYKTVAGKNDAFKDFCQDIADKVGGELVMGPVKDKNRAKAKVDKDFGGDYSKLNDVVRSTIILKTPHQVHRAMKKVFQENEDKVEKFFADFKSEGYNGGNMNLRMPDGTPTEIQFNTPINLALKDTIIDHPLINRERDKLTEGGVIPGKGHDFYEKIQEMDRMGEAEGEKKKKLESWMKRYYGFRDYFQIFLLATFFIFLR